ncbi:MAG TPA: hypothetical protein VN105_02865 [Chitinophaga sp.]|nr:hypothetical protein [Chitinophaga sp.]
MDKILSKPLVQVFAIPVLKAAIFVLITALYCLFGTLHAGSIPVKVQVDVPVFFHDGPAFLKEGQRIEDKKIGGWWLIVINC